MDGIRWRKQGQMRLYAQIPGLRLEVAGSWPRWPCTRRWGWAVYDQAGVRLAGSNPVRHGAISMAINGCVRYLQAHHAIALEEGLRGG